SLGSGSKGNCFALDEDGAILLLDAGFSAREIGRRATVAGLDLSYLRAIAVTHEHGDHASGAAQLARKHGVPILASPGTWSALRGADGVRHIALRAGEPVDVGSFRVAAAATNHDAAEPVALTVWGPSGIRVGLAHDLGRPTAAVRYLLRELSVLVLEANHDEILLRTSEYPAAVRQRIAGGGGHLSNRAAAELLEELVHPHLEHVVLAHLSERCNTPEEARATILPTLARAGFRGVLHVAMQNEAMWVEVRG
ncbi:MAG: MBL fold metallo-hydrolase, partial [Gemmatimonadales bacterium]